VITTYTTEFRRYRTLIDGALAQLSDAAINVAPMEGGNSVAMLLAHLAGNLRSRFTDFLTTDGEKTWRDRDGEFASTEYDRTTIEAESRAGWDVLEAALDSLTDGDLEREVMIRGVALTADEALARSLAHVAYHTGQIVLLAQMQVGEDWKSLSIPRGGSHAYNANPTLEKGPSGT